MFYLLFICSCLIVCSEIPFSESLCFIEASQFNSPIQYLTSFCFMWDSAELNLRTHLRVIFVLYVPFYKPVFAIIYLTAISFSILMFRVIKRVSIYLFSMPVSLAQWRGEKGAFYNNTLAFSKISTFYLLLSLPYGSIFCRLDLIKLLFLIISLILNGIMFFHFKKCRNNNLKIGVYLFTTIYLLIISNLLEYLWVASRIISLSGDIEINSGPKANALNRCFSTCHWNLSSISAHMFTKVSLLSAYISVHKFDIICLSETYL